MYYNATPQPGLGDWWNPFTWGDGTPATPAADPDALRVAGDVRYLCSLYQFMRQSRTWLYAKRLAFQNAPESADAALGYVKCNEGFERLTDLETQLEPEMQKIDTVARKNDSAWRRPKDFGYTWPGSAGDATHAPTPPPAATPLTAAEAGIAPGLGSLAGWALGIGTALITAGIVVATAFAAPVIGLLLVSIASILILLTVLGDTPGGQQAIKDVGKGVHDVLDNTSIVVPLIVGAMALVFLSGDRRTKSRAQR